MKPISAGKWVFLAAVLMNVLGTLLSPILASVSHWWAGFYLYILYLPRPCKEAGPIFCFPYRALIGARIFEGLGGGVTFPGILREDVPKKTAVRLDFV